MIVPYLSDVAIYCEQAVFFFHPTLAVPRRVGQAALPSHLPVCTLCSEFTLPRSKELQGFELQPQLKDNAVAVACDFEISNLFLFLKGALTRQRAKLSFLQFCFSVKNQKTQLALFAPNQHAAALVVDCRGVNHMLFFCMVVHMFHKRYLCCTSFNEKKKGKRRAHILQNDHSSFSQTYILLFFHLIPNICQTFAKL